MAGDVQLAHPIVSPLQFLVVIAIAIPLLFAITWAVYVRKIRPHRLSITVENGITIIRYRWFSHHFLAVGFFIALLLFMAVSALTYQFTTPSAGKPVGTVLWFGCIVAALSWHLLSGIKNVTTIYAQRNRIDVHQGPFILLGAKTQSIVDAIKVYAVQTYGRRGDFSTEIYAIFVKLPTGTAVKLLDDVDGRATTEEIVATLRGSVGGFLQ